MLWLILGLITRYLLMAFACTTSSLAQGSHLVLLAGRKLVWVAQVIPALAERFTVIAPDLWPRDSDRPMTGYDKALASDVYALTQTLGFSKIGLTGHDGVVQSRSTLL
jgi:pimeloyl-ACP methyl ester carboxylesterase